MPDEPLVKLEGDDLREAECLAECLASVDLDSLPVAPAEEVERLLAQFFPPPKSSWWDEGCETIDHLHAKLKREGLT